MQSCLGERDGVVLVGQFIAWAKRGTEGKWRGVGVGDVEVIARFCVDVKQLMPRVVGRIGGED